MPAACFPRINLRPRAIEVAVFTGCGALQDHAAERHAERRFLAQIHAIERGLARSTARHLYNR